MIVIYHQGPTFKDNQWIMKDCRQSQVWALFCSLLLYLERWVRDTPSGTLASWNLEVEALMRYRTNSVFSSHHFMMIRGRGGLRHKTSAPDRCRWYEFITPSHREGFKYFTTDVQFMPIPYFITIQLYLWLVWTERETHYTATSEQMGMLCNKHGYQSLHYYPWI